MLDPMPFDISIIIPTLDECETIATAVEHAWATQPREVLVVDGGSRDKTCEIARQHGAQVFESPRGRAWQQNLGSQHAQGEVLLFLHADNRLAPDGLQQIADALKDPSVLSGAFRQLIDASGWISRAIEYGNAQRASRHGSPYGDQGIFVRRETFEAVGRFPEVRLMEDLLLARRLRRLAKPVLLPGPLRVSARRWQKHGPVRQTLRNWSLLAAERLGASPDTLARYYPSHSNGRADS